MPKKKSIQLYADGLNLDEFGKDYSIEIDGYTFNPSIFRKNGIEVVGIREQPLKKLMENDYLVRKNSDKFEIVRHSGSNDRSLIQPLPKEIIDEKPLN